MTLDNIDRKQARALDRIAHDLHFMSPTDRQEYAARLLDHLSRIFVGYDVDAEKLNLHPDPTLFTSVIGRN